MILVSTMTLMMWSATMAQVQPASVGEKGEWFVGLFTVIDGGPARRRMLRFSPFQKPELMVDAADPGVEREFSGGLVDGKGNMLDIRRVSRAGERGRRLVPAGPGPQAAFRLFENMLPGNLTISPDGRWLAANYTRPLQGGGVLGFGDQSSTVEIPHTWALLRPLSWSPDSTRVAFYYALGDDRDDVWIQLHGVAVASTQGKLQVILPAEEAVGTPAHTFAKDVPIGWSRCGRFLYYTDGADVSLDRPRLDPPTETYQFDFETERRQRVSEGAFLAVAPDNRYVLFCMEIKGEDQPRSVTAQLVLESGEIRHLPDKLFFPQISPSGTLAVASFRSPGTPPSEKTHDLQFYRTSDWQPVGEPLARAREASPVETWFRDFKWITVPVEESP